MISDLKENPGVCACVRDVWSEDAEHKLFYHEVTFECLGVSLIDGDLLI